MKQVTPQEENIHGKNTRVLVAVEKKASKAVANKAKRATRALNEILENNHFTIKIYRAAGGTTKGHK